MSDAKTAKRKKNALMLTVAFEWSRSIECPARDDRAAQIEERPAAVARRFLRLAVVSRPKERRTSNATASVAAAAAASTSNDASPPSAADPSRHARRARGPLRRFGWRLQAALEDLPRLRLAGASLQHGGGDPWILFLALQLPQRPPPGFIR